MTNIKVPFSRPDIGAREIDEVAATLRSGWVTTGPKARLFEQNFKNAVRSRYALAVNSCTAALHLAVEALGARERDAVLVPTMTFAATAEVVRYQRATPILVDCDPLTLNLDLADAGEKADRLQSGRLLNGLTRGLSLVGIMPVHVGGLMVNMGAVHHFAATRRLWVVEDAAHAFPAAWRPTPAHPWQQCGERTAAVTCFSFYANKTITTGEGGMAVTDDEALASRMRAMALHGLSTDAWERYSANGSWDYQIIAPGFKYNLSDIAAAVGIHQLARAADMRSQRARVADQYIEAFSDLDEIELPPLDGNRQHTWHLFPIRIRLDELSIDRDEFIRELTRLGIGCSVHWRPLHLHPYYRETFNWRPDQFPVATAVWKRLVSLPIFSSMTPHDVDAVIAAVRAVCARHRRPRMAVRITDRELPHYATPKTVLPTISHHRRSSHRRPQSL